MILLNAYITKEPWEHRRPSLQFLLLLTRTFFPFFSSLAFSSEFSLAKDRKKAPFLQFCFIKCFFDFLFLSSSLILLCFGESHPSGLWTSATTALPERDFFIGPSACHGHTWAQAGPLTGGQRGQKLMGPRSFEDTRKRKKIREMRGKQATYRPPMGL